jgi:DNA-binding response OmpR family regulator
MKSILVVDDDPAILEAIQISLELEGYIVHTAHDGVGALDLAQKESPQLMVLDVLLSGDDGRDIAKKIKSMTNTASIPIVMMSAHPNIEQSVLDAGADHFMPKPFDIDQLLSFAHKYLKNQE